MKNSKKLIAAAFFAAFQASALCGCSQAEYERREQKENNELAGHLAQAAAAPTADRTIRDVYTQLAQNLRMGGEHARFAREQVRRLNTVINNSRNNA